MPSNKFEKLGLRPEDVQHIFVTHLDFDHAGEFQIFPMQRYMFWLLSLMQRNRSLSKGKLRYKTEQFKQHRHWNFAEHTDGEAWFNLQQVQGLPFFQDEI